MKQIDFIPPKALVLPENKEDGDTFSVLAEFKIKGKKLCLVGIDGNEMAGYEDDSDEKEESPEGKAAKIYSDNYQPPGMDGE